MSKQQGSSEQYKAVTINSGVEEANPHRLIQMLLEGALNKITLARAAIGRGDKAAKANHISSAHAIIEGLQVSLDKDRGRDIAENLDRLYEYMAHRLVGANLKDDLSILDEIHRLLSDIKSAWEAIAQQSQRSSSTRSDGVSFSV